MPDQPHKWNSYYSPYFSNKDLPEQQQIRLKIYARHTDKIDKAKKSSFFILGEAALLWSDLEPARYIDFRLREGSPHSDIDKPFLSAIPKKAKENYRCLLNGLNEDSYHYEFNNYLSKVRARWLKRWFKKRGEHPPFLFPDKPKEKATKRSTTSNKPESQHITPLMELVADAAAEFWQGVDPQDPRAPTTEAVKDWLGTELVKRSIKNKGQTGKLSEAIATIIRHPERPTGKMGVTPKKNNRNKR